MATFTIQIQQHVPVHLRRNFWHLYLDIAWFGVLSGSAINFMAIFATRQGASGWQMGLLNAAPALMTLGVALPFGRWLGGRPPGRVAFWAAAAHRAGYLLWIALPAFFAPADGVAWLIASVFAMSVPGTMLAISFNNLFATAVPADWRGRVVGVRNAVYAATAIVVSLGCGWLLSNLPFTLGYQLVFAIGAVGGIMSTLHLWFVRPVEVEGGEVQERPRHLAAISSVAGWRPGRAGFGWRTLLRGHTLQELLSLEVMNGRFRLSILLLFGLHLAQYSAIPLFPLYTVNILGLSDQVLSVGSIYFYVAMFLGALQLGRLSSRWGYHRMLAVGALLMSLFPLLVTAAVTVPLYYFASAVGGLAWTLAGGAVSNYLLERVPEDNRPPYLAWYNLSLHAAMLVGSLIGPLLAGWVGLAAALLLTAVLRFVAGLCLWRWGG